MNIHIPIPTKRIMQILVAILLLLAIGHLASIVLRFTPNHHSIGGATAFIRLFYWDTEGNIPTWFSSTLLLLSSSLMVLIANTQKFSDKRFYWIGLAIIFLGLSLDESAAIHEHLNGPVRSLLKSEEYLYFAWVIPGLIFVGLLGVIYWRFLLELPGQIRNLFCVAGAMFIIGAIGFEILGSHYWKTFGPNSFAFIALSTIEELLEMVSIIVFIHALLIYITSWTLAKNV